MKAVVKTHPDPGNVALIDVPEPSAGPGEVVIEVKNAGVCGTDLHIFKSEYIIAPPVILGHEFCGIVAEVGAGVTRCHVGDRVTVNPSAGRLCGRCRYCQIGAPFFCSDRAAVGSGMNGGFAKYCCVREDIVLPLSDNLSFEAGALVEPFACAFQAMVELTSIHPGDLVVVSGPGPIGTMCALLARTRGARVALLGLSKDKTRLAHARRLGIDYTIDVEVDDPREFVADLTHGYGAEVVVECAGAAPSAVLCLDLVCKMGSYTQAGIFGHPLELDLDRIVMKQVRLQGSICHTWETWSRALWLLSQHLIDLHTLITARLPLSRWEEAFERSAAGTDLKILLHPEE